MTEPIQAAVLCLALLAATDVAAQQTGIGYRPATDADSKKTILLRDFHPEPALRAAVHEIRRANTFPTRNIRSRGAG
jgi:hypothetical protein